MEIYESTISIGCVNQTSICFSLKCVFLPIKFRQHCIYCLLVETINLHNLPTIEYPLTAPVRQLDIFNIPPINTILLLYMTLILTLNQ